MCFRSRKVVPLLQKLQPKHVLFPEDLRSLVGFPDSKPFSVVYYDENNTLRVDSLKKDAELEISADLASKFRWITLKEEDLDIARLKGDLYVEQGKHRLLVGNGSDKMQIGSEKLSILLQNMGIKTSVEQTTNDVGSSRSFVLHVNEPSKALVQVEPTRIVISSVDKALASRIFEAVNTLLSPN